MKGNARYTPTPEEIEREAAKIREGWSTQEKHLRGGNEKPVYSLRLLTTTCVYTEQRREM